MNKFLELALAGVQQLVPYVPGKPVEELRRELGLTEIVKLASNENPLGTGGKVAAAIAAALPELTRYPDGSGFSLKTALSAKLGVGPEQITLGNGSSEILELLARTFVTPAQEVVFSQHAFALYPILTQAVGAKAKIAPAKNYGHDLAAMQALISGDTRLVFIANPNNPTGTLLPFYEALLRKGVIVRPIANYEMPSHLRVSIGTARENQLFIDALGQVLRGV